MAARRRQAAWTSLAAGGGLAVAVLALAAAVLAALAPPAGAGPSLADLEREARRARAEMAALQRQLDRVGARLVAAEQRLDAVSARLQESRQAQARAELALELQRQALAARAATLYKTGDLTLLDVLAGLRSFTDLESLRELERDVAEADRAAEERAEALARDARRLARQVEAEREEALAAAAEVRDRKADLDAQLARRQALLQEITARIRKLLSRGGLAAALRLADGGEFTQVTWAKALLVALRMPVTADNVAAIVAWEMAEGGHWYNGASYNPLNTTMPMPGATAMNSVGVKAYTSWAQGLEATVRTLRNGLYEGVLAALRRGDDASAVAAAVGASPWGTGDFSRLL